MLLDDAIESLVVRHQLSLFFNALTVSFMHRGMVLSLETPSTLPTGRLTGTVDRNSDRRLCHEALPNHERVEQRRRHECVPRRLTAFAHLLGLVERDGLAPLSREAGVLLAVVTQSADITGVELTSQCVCGCLKSVRRLRRRHHRHGRCFWSTCQECRRNRRQVKSLLRRPIAGAIEQFSDEPHLCASTVKRVPGHAVSMHRPAATRAVVRHPHHARAHCAVWKSGHCTTQASAMMMPCAQ